MHEAGMRTLLALAVTAGCLAAQHAVAEDYPYRGVFMNFERKTYNAFSPALKDVACYEHLFVQDEKGDFTTYVLDGLQWLLDRKIVYLVKSSGHCDFFASGGIEQGQMAASSTPSPGPRVCIADQTSSRLVPQNRLKLSTKTAGSRIAGASR